MRKGIDKTGATKETYSYLWRKDTLKRLPEEWHFDAMQEVINEPIVRGSFGIDIGSGCGYDSFFMAQKNPEVKIVSIDISDGVSKTKELTSTLNNVFVVKCCFLNTPLKDGIFDFAYSFGVLHHTTSPKQGLLEIARILKKKSPAFLYLYEDHAESFFKRLAIKLVTLLRLITVKMPSRAVYLLSWFCSPLVFVSFSLPAKILSSFKPTHDFACKIPFNFGQGPFSLCGDLYDRFKAPIEHRFSKEEVRSLFSECGFCNVNITRLKRSPGWVVWGEKK